MTPAEWERLGWGAPELDLASTKHGWQPQLEEVLAPGNRPAPLFPLWSPHPKMAASWGPVGSGSPSEGPTDETEGGCRRS